MGAKRSALQVLGSAAPALDFLASWAEQATSGESCGYADCKVASDGVSAALHDRVAAFGAATVLGCLAELLKPHLLPLGSSARVPRRAPAVILSGQVAAVFSFRLDRLSWCSI